MKKRRPGGLAGETAGDALRYNGTSSPFTLPNLEVNITDNNLTSFFHCPFHFSSPFSFSPLLMLGLSCVHVVRYTYILVDMLMTI
jgi:hypothetical protein